MAAEKLDSGHDESMADEAAQDSTVGEDDAAFPLRNRKTVQGSSSTYTKRNSGLCKMRTTSARMSRRRSQRLSRSRR